MELVLFQAHFFTALTSSSALYFFSKQAYVSFIFSKFKDINIVNWAETEPDYLHMRFKATKITSVRAQKQ